MSKRCHISNAFLTRVRRASLVAQLIQLIKTLLTSTALRLYPSVPVNLRIAQRTTWLPRGGGPDGDAPLLVRQGMGVGFLPYYLHRRRDLYGDDAHEFRPERWEEPKLANIGWGYIPFHGGPRICLGSEFRSAPIKHINLRSLGV